MKDPRKNFGETDFYKELAPTILATWHKSPLYWRKEKMNDKCVYIGNLRPGRLFGGTAARQQNRIYSAGGISPCVEARPGTHLFKICIWKD